MDSPPPIAMSKSPEFGFLEMASSNPCTTCTAPCCRVLLIPHKPPTTFSDVDYIRYMVGFRNVEMIVSSDGQWQVCVTETCRLLDQSTNLCTVHDTPRQPRVCAGYSPYDCWYKRNLGTASPPEIIRIDSDGLEAILAHIRLDANGNIVEVPEWDSLKAMVVEASAGVTR